VNIQIALALVICIIGAVIYFVSTKPKVEAVALHCFWVGLLAFLIEWGGKLAITK
jgi:hypothetical protein